MDLSELKLQQLGLEKQKYGNIYTFVDFGNVNYWYEREVCLDAVRFIKKYDTFCLLSGDADFAYLADFLKRQGKKIILISSGFVSHWLKDKADLNINSQQIKRHITFVKEKPRL